MVQLNVNVYFQISSTILFELLNADRDALINVISNLGSLCC